MNLQRKLLHRVQIGKIFLLNYEAYEELFDEVCGG